MYESESVTVSIGPVLKGNPDSHVWNFINENLSATYTKVVDTLTGEIRTSTVRLSIENPMYVSIINQEYLFFCTANDLLRSGNVVFQRMLSRACDPFTYSYKINSGGGILYDGFDYDTILKTVTDVPEIIFPFDEFVDLVIDVSFVDKIPVVRARNQFSAPMAVFDLLGKRMRYSGMRTSLHRTPGLFIQTDPVQGKLSGGHITSLHQ